MAKVNRYEYTRGDIVFLKSEFRNGSTIPKEKRIYPKGTLCIVKAVERTMLWLIVDDPPGAVYAMKEIRIPKSDVTRTRTKKVVDELNRRV